MHNHHEMMQHGGMMMHEGHMMKMWFHGGYNEVILFDFWRIDSLSGLIFSFIAIFIMGAMYEGIKWFRVYLQMNSSATHSSHRRENGITLQHVVHDKAPLQNEVARSNSNEDVYNPTTTPPSHAIRSQNRRSSPYSSSPPFSSVRLIQAALYIIQLVLAYWLMLIVMTYNTWLTIAVIVGAGFGHWLFAVLKFQDTASETADSFATDACH
ncbi:Ctr copper transporter family protein [Oesophagostomum dentatum]|uniref:Copper transport protein n=1 Tax=Oesophagostomum dentatum TaxID=61180 RepID=A0A0B1T5D2_OESDE|nr:Ctr copper transporter family protein [Oesophagostomum dentatum]